MIKRLIFISLIFQSILIAAAEQKVKIAVIPFEAVEVEMSTAKSVTGIFTTEMVKSDKFEVVEREQLKRLIHEKNIIISNSSDADAVMQAGKILAVDKLVIGSVSKLGDKLFISARLVDVKKTKVDYAERFEVVDLANLAKRTEELAAVLIDKLIMLTIPTKIRPYETYSYISVGVSALLLTGGIFSSFIMDDKLDKSDNASTESKRDAYHDEARTYYYLRNASYISAGVFAAAGVGLFFITEEKNVSVSSLEIGKDKVYMAVSFSF